MTSGKAGQHAQRQLCGEMRRGFVCTKPYTEVFARMYAYVQHTPFMILERCLTLCLGFASHLTEHTTAKLPPHTASPVAFLMHVSHIMYAHAERYACFKSQGVLIQVLQP